MELEAIAQEFSDATRASREGGQILLTFSDGTTVLLSPCGPDCCLIYLIEPGGQEALRAIERSQAADWLRRALQPPEPPP